jgi:hypothetical protein
MSHSIAPLGTWHLALGTWHLALSTWHLKTQTQTLSSNHLGQISVFQQVSRLNQNSTNLDAEQFVCARVRTTQPSPLRTASMLVLKHTINDKYFFAHKYLLV